MKTLEHYDALWRGLVAAQDEFRARLAELQAQEGVMFPGRESWQRIIKDQDTECREMLRSAITDIFREIHGLAESQFAPVGFDHVDIPEAPYKERFVEPILDSGNWLDFDPKGLYAAIEADYGEQAGRDKAYRDAAERIVRAFGLRENPNIERKAGTVVLNLTVYTESDYLDPRNRHLGYGRARDYLELLQALRGFAAWADLDDLHDGLDSYLRRLYRDHKIPVQSRERITVSDQLIVITYYNRFEFRLIPEVADQLQIFIGTFAAQEEAA